MVLRTSIEIPDIEIEQVFDQFAREIEESLTKKGVKARINQEGNIEESAKPVGHITDWNRPNSISLEWWSPETRGRNFVTLMTIRFHSLEDSPGTEMVIENRGWENILLNTGTDPVDWFTDVVAAPILASMTPMTYGQWLIDRIARKPSGTASKKHYSDPVYHKPNFDSILTHLNLTKEDYLVEIGCGGGYFLSQALKSGCRAAGIDHSPDMVDVARKQNSLSIEEGKLSVTEADASALPYPDDQFTCAVSTGVLHFIADPKPFFSEAYRVLKKGGRFILFLGTKKLRGTPAEPDPITQDFLWYYEDEELVNLATGAGFTEVSVVHPEQLEAAIRAGVPEEHLSVFSDPTFGQLLIAHK